MATRFVARRQVLRGGGATAIGLPFLLARTGDPRAAPSGPPERLLTVFLGGGIPTEFSAAGLVGPLAPLAPHADRLAMVRGIDARAMAPGNGHTRGSSAFACGVSTDTFQSKGGPSLDWAAFEELRPATARSVMAAGVFAATIPEQRARTMHSWRGAGRPNEPFADPLRLFQFSFGGAGVLAADSPEEKVARVRARTRVSVLDAVVDDYRRAIGPSGGHSRAVRSLIAGHLETVRELEQRAAADTRQLSPGQTSLPVECSGATAPAGGTTGANVLPVWGDTFSIMAQLTTLALRCDLVRFGNLVLIGGGDSFPYFGSAGGYADVHADVYHGWPGKNPAALAGVVEWQMQAVARLLDQLADPGYREENGGTLLDNTTVLIGTELNHPGLHQHDRLTFFIAGGRGRWRAGRHDFAGRSDVDLYNTVLRSMGIQRTFGDQRHFQDLLPILS